MISLNGTVSLPKMNHVSIAVCQNLKFNMAWMLYKMFNVHGAICKCHLSFFLCRLKTCLKFICILGDTHSFSPSAKCGFYDDRITYFLCNLCSRLRIIYRLLTSGNDRHPCLDHRVSRLSLVAHFADDIRIRSDKSNMTLLTKLHKLAVFRQKPKSGMNRICA